MFKGWRGTDVNDQERWEQKKANHNLTHKESDFQTKTGSKATQKKPQKNRRQQEKQNNRRPKKKNIRKHKNRNPEP